MGIAEAFMLFTSTTLFLGNANLTPGYDQICLTETEQAGKPFSEVKGCKATHRVITTYLYPQPGFRYAYKDKCETLEHAEARKQDLQSSQHGETWYKPEIITCEGDKS